MKTGAVGICSQRVGRNARVPKDGNLLKGDIKGRGFLLK